MPAVNKHLGPIGPKAGVQFAAFPVDHFGIVADSVFAAALALTGDRRARKSAVNSLITIAKLSKQIPQGATVLSVGLCTDHAGQIYYEFQYTSADAASVTTNIVRSIDELVEWKTNDNS